MNLKLIKQLREKNNLTQAELAKKLNVSDKTISKWETEKGYPDITLLEPLSKALNISVTELFSGQEISNNNHSGNIQKSKFYVCPICGNVIHSMGEAVIICHGFHLIPLQVQEDEGLVRLEKVEDEYYVQINHEMTKSHYISFIAILYFNEIKIIKLYPQQEAAGRFKINGARKILYYCNKDGLFKMNIVKGFSTNK